MGTSNIISFNEIVISLTHLLGTNNLTNEIPLIRRFIIDAEHEINPYSSLLVKKRMTYHKGNGNFDGKSIVKPKDFVRIDTIGSCKDGLCVSQYTITPTFIVICDGKKRDSITFTYYGYASDGTGNPFTTINHKEAVLAYLEYMFYRPKMNKGVGNHNYFMTLQRNWEDRCMESRGEDAMNEIFSDLDSAVMTSQMSIQSMTIQDSLSKNDACCSSLCFVVDYDDNEYMNKKVYFWQFDQVSSNPNIEDLTDEDLLKDKPSADLKEFLDGRLVNYTKISKYAFVINNINSPDDIVIYDLTGSNLENTLDSYYDPFTKRLVFLSKNIISHSSIYFKFKYNGK